MGATMPPTSGVFIRLETRNKAGVVQPRRASARVSDNNPHSPWLLSGSATDKAMAAVG